jgi:hypothetical protein
LHMSIFLLTFAPLNREVLSLYHPWGNQSNGSEVGLVVSNRNKVPQY